MNPAAILCADVHLVEPGFRPACRSDDVFQAQLTKLDAIRGLQGQHGDIPVLCAGDIFNRWRASPELLAAVIPRIRNWIAVPGQHDLPNHKLELYHRSGLAVLEAAGCIRVLKEWDHALRKGWGIVGFPWGSPLNLDNKNKKALATLSPLHVALVHHFVYPGAPPFPGADEYGSKAEDVLRTMTGFDLILTGDNHEQFGGVRADDDDALLLNPGPVVRLTATLADHEPSVFLWDAESNTVERSALPHDPDAVTRDHLEEEAQRDSRISELVARLQVEGDWDEELDFRKNLVRACALAKVPETVESRIWAILEETK